MQHPFTFIDYIKHLGSLFKDWDSCLKHKYKPNGMYSTCVECGHTKYSGG